MALHLVEIHLDMSSKERAERAMTAANNVASGHMPPGFSLVAGPWMSNEEAKLVVVVDFDDHNATLDFFWPAVARGTVLRRRFTPLVELADLEAVIAKL